MWDQKCPKIPECCCSQDRQDTKWMWVLSWDRQGCSEQKWIFWKQGRKDLCVSRNLLPQIHGDEDETWTEPEPDKVLTLVGLFGLMFSFSSMSRGVSCASLKELDLLLEGSRASKVGRTLQPMDPSDSPNEEGTAITSHGTSDQSIPTPWQFCTYSAWWGGRWNIL